MKSLFHLCFFVALTLPVSAFAQAHSPAHLKAAEAVLDAAGLEKTFSPMIENMMEVQSKQLPDSLRTKFVGVMKVFMGKYFTYAQIKPGMAKIYADEFSEAELKDLAKFYSTPVGKKAAERLPVLQQKGMELGVGLVQQHQAELQQMMEEAFKSKQ